MPAESCFADLEVMRRYEPLQLLAWDLALAKGVSIYVTELVSISNPGELVGNFILARLFINKLDNLLVLGKFLFKKYIRHEPPIQGLLWML